MTADSQESGAIGKSAAVIGGVAIACALNLWFPVISVGKHYHLVVGMLALGGVVLGIVGLLHGTRRRTAAIGLGLSATALLLAAAWTAWIIRFERWI